MLLVNEKQQRSALISSSSEENRNRRRNFSWFICYWSAPLRLFQNQFCAMARFICDFFYWTRPFSVIWHNSLYISLQSWFWCLIFKLADSKLWNACDVAFGEGGLGATQKRLIQGGSPLKSNPLPFDIPFFLSLKGYPYVASVCSKMILI